MNVQSALDPSQQLPMYAVSDELAPRVAQLGLESNLAELQEQGFTVVRAERDLTDRLREAILSATRDAPGPNATFERVCCQPLGLDPVFTDICVHPVVLAFAEYLCGRGFLLSSSLVTVRKAGSAIALHSDESWLPSPFPEHNPFMTACWITDDFNRENGATCFVPGSHRLRRPPTEEEATSCLADAVPIEAPAGSIAIWDGAVWHGNVPRTAAGERAVAHISYGRLGYQTFHDFSYVGQSFRDTAPPQMRALLGENLGFRTNTMYEHFDVAKFGPMSADVRR